MMKEKGNFEGEGEGGGWFVRRKGKISSDTRVILRPD